MHLGCLLKRQKQLSTLRSDAVMALVYASLLHLCLYDRSFNEVVAVVQSQNNH